VTHPRCAFRRVASRDGAILNELFKIIPSATSLCLHRYAAFVAFAIFLLIIAGALVNSNDAGLGKPFGLRS